MAFFSLSVTGGRVPATGLPAQRARFRAKRKMRAQQSSFPHSPSRARTRKTDARHDQAELDDRRGAPQGAQEARPGHRRPQGGARRAPAEGARRRGDRGRNGGRGACRTGGTLRARMRESRVRSSGRRRAHRAARPFARRARASRPEAPRRPSRRARILPADSADPIAHIRISSARI